MDTAVRPTAPPIAEPAAPKRRWPWVAAIGAVVLAVAIGTTTAWITNLEPLGPGSAMFGTAGVRITIPTPAPLADSFDVDALGVSGGVIEIPLRPEMRFTYLVSIRNAGPVDIRIMDVGQGSPTGQVSRHIVAFRAVPGSPTLGTFAPFHPFTLAPGVEAALRIEVDVTQSLCMSSGSYTSWWSEPVTFRVLGFPGFTRHTEVDTRTEIRLVGDGHTDC